TTPHAQCRSWFSTPGQAQTLTTTAQTHTGWSCLCGCHSPQHHPRPAAQTSLQPLHTRWSRPVPPATLCCRTCLPRTPPTEHQQPAATTRTTTTTTRRRRKRARAATVTAIATCWTWTPLLHPSRNCDRN
ncbi:hypothetical protein BC831DRAFT_552383, partial [Entophlyctis helioformis]